MRTIFVFLFVFCFTANAHAQTGCESLAPTNAQSVEEAFKGQIEGKISGLIGRLAGGQASINGEYKKLTTDTLKEYPDSHKIYVWQRIIYLACVKPNSGIDINKLFELYLSGPPPSDQNSSSLQKVKLIHTTWADADNARIVEQLTALDGKKVFIDTLSADLSVHENLAWAKNCFPGGENSEAFEGKINGVEIPIPVPGEDEVCYHYLEIDSGDQRAYPLTHGGTGVISIIVRKRFLVNVLRTGAYTTFNLREVSN